MSDLTDGELHGMERLLRNGKADLDVNTYRCMARELLAEIHRQRAWSSARENRSAARSER